MVPAGEVTREHAQEKVSAVGSLMVLYSGGSRPLMWRSMPATLSVTVIVVIRYFVRRCRMTGRADTVFTVSMDKMRSWRYRKRRYHSKTERRAALSAH